MSNETLQTRDGFKSQWGFILACIGSAVGMGNIWRFPIMVARWGGLTFLIPYFIIVLLVGPGPPGSGGPHRRLRPLHRGEKRQ